MVMTANDPSRQQEALNHCDVELPGQSNRSNTQLGIVDFDVLVQVERALLYRLEELAQSG